jgi:hypothetical protein
MENPHPVAVTARTATGVINQLNVSLIARKPAHAGFLLSVIELRILNLKGAHAILYICEEGKFPYEKIIDLLKKL